jgi:two-component system phosphate regulon sensor histidine kinase PhoR
LDNALKFTGPDGEIGVTLSWDESDIHLSVQDSGCGIEERQYEKIFEPFTLAEDSFTRSTGGIGLGLPLAKRIVLLHHGTITVKSTVGMGSKFTLHLPLSCLQVMENHPPEAGLSLVQNAKQAF